MNVHSIRQPPKAYLELAKTAGWGERNRYGIAYSEHDPLDVLRVAEAPEIVVEAIAAAITIGCEVKWQSYACHIGGWESVVVVAPVPDEIRAMLDAIDRSEVRDGRMVVMRDRRWFEARLPDQRERWEWTIDDG